MSSTVEYDAVTPTTGTCYQGYIRPINTITYPVLANTPRSSVPNYAINVQTVSDVQNGVAFAQANNIPLVIKNTGHDYKGRSSAPNSLALWYVSIYTTYNSA